MTQELSNTVFLSLFYTGLSLVMIIFVAKATRNVLIFCSLYFLLIGGVAWMAGPKWLLIGSIAFMITAMSFTLWIVYRQSKECIRDLKAIHKEEKKVQTSKNGEDNQSLEESKHGK